MTFQTREEMILARKNAERSQAMAKRAATKPTITASRVNGGVKLVIVNPTQELRAVMDANGFVLETDLSNTYARICAMPEDLTVVQNAVRGFFGR